MEQDANYYLSIMVENNQLPYIKRTQFAREAWVQLAKHHRKTSLTTKIRLLRKLYHEVLSNGGDMKDHLSKLMSYYDELCEVVYVVCETPPTRKLRNQDKKKNAFLHTVRVL